MNEQYLGDQILDSSTNIDGVLGNNGNIGDAKKGRKIDPEVLEKYLKIKQVMSERPNAFSRAELCKKHGVNYHNFSQWISKQKPKERTEPKFKPGFIPPVVGQSVIMCTMDDLMNILTPLIRDAIKGAILEGSKHDKIKILR